MKNIFKLSKKTPLQVFSSANHVSFEVRNTCKRAKGVKMKNLFSLLIFVFISIQMFAQNQSELPAGIWRAAIKGGVKEIPFLIEVKKTAEKGYEIDILNGKERLSLKEIQQNGNQITIPLHIFDAQMVATLNPKTNILEGVFQKLYTKQPYELPFKAIFGEKNRFPKNSQNTKQNFTGKYDVELMFANGITKAVGVFEQKNGILEGTFLTPTGDYRFLEGVAFGTNSGDSLQISCFDGEHLYLFEAQKVQDSEVLEGIFYSGKSQGIRWTAKRNENAKLPDAYSLSENIDPNAKIDLTFPAIKGGVLSTNDAKYKGKPLIIQLFGTWCPNCMDETQFLAKWYKENSQKGIEVIGLDFEYKNDLEYAKNRVQKVVNRFGVTYDFAFAGDISEENRQKAMPFLKRIMAFPTTIFVDRNGNIAKIHTGYSGPATGKYYEDFVKEFNEMVEKLLKK